MTKSLRKAFVYVSSIFAGILEENEEGYSFKYDEEYLSSTNPLPVSLTLPLRKEEYTSSTLFSFFDGLIPEGWMLEEALRNWKIDRRDRFSLLLYCCNDCIGNVSVRRDIL